MTVITVYVPTVDFVGLAGALELELTCSMLVPRLLLLGVAALPTRFPFVRVHCTYLDWKRPPNHKPTSPPTSIP